jgi:diguanylate cyclase (GGDEF)-like protein/PAS domain S-box-containing protein
VDGAAIPSVNAHAGGGDDRARPVSEEARDAILTSVLSLHPDAPLAAINDEGLFVTVPSVALLAGHPVLPGRSALDLVVPADHLAVIEAWAELRRTGAARVTVQLVGTEVHHAELSFVDMTHRFGVHVGMLLSQQDGGGTLRHLERVVVVTPKVCRIEKDERAVVTAIDAAATKILGWTSEELVGRRSLEIIHPDDQQRAIENWMEMLASPRSSMRWRGRHKCRDGSWLWIDTTNRYSTRRANGRGRVVAEMVDVSDEIAAHEAVREREQILDRLAEALPLGVFQLDTNRQFLYKNSQLAQMSGIDDITDFSMLVDSAVDEDRETLTAAVTSVLDGEGSDVEIRVHHRGCEDTRLWAINLRPLTGESGQTVGAVGCAVDITESARLRAALEHKASYDDLTGCHNRASVMAGLEAAISRDLDRGTGTRVIFVDLDRFKSINDSLGHAGGDRMLQVIVERLGAAVREGDLVGRVGGDEFLVVSSGLRKPREVRALARRLAHHISKPVEVDGAIIHPKASLGIAFSCGRPCSAEALVRSADSAMYATKRTAIKDETQASPGATAQPAALQTSR